MKIGDKLKSIRTQRNMTQEQVCEVLEVSRQTISNWENSHSYPDIISIIKLSDLYNISLDDLLKEDKAMVYHMKESMNIVESNKRLSLAIIINILLFIVMILCNQWIATNTLIMACFMIFAILSISVLFYQIIKRF